MFIEITELTIGINRGSFQAVFSSGFPLISSSGHPKVYECVLVEGMVGKWLAEEGDSYQVQFPFYPYPIFVFQEHAQKIEIAKEPFEPIDLEERLSRLKKSVGKPYLWGGNFPFPTQNFVDRFHYQGKTKLERRAVTLDGLDCSGLLFFSFNYRLPRNTAELQSFGVPIEMGEALRPMDLILTQGHVRMILNDREVIQSKQTRGVYLSRLKDELAFLSRKFRRVSEVTGANQFSIRRVC